MALVGTGSKIKKYEIRQVVPSILFVILLVSLVFNWHTVSALTSVVGAILVWLLFPVSVLKKKLVKPLLGTLLMLSAYLIAYRFDLHTLSSTSLLLVVTPWLLVGSFLKDKILWRAILLALIAYGLVLAFINMPEQVIEYYRQGNVLTTPIHHGTWSLLIGIPSVWMLWLGYKRKNWLDLAIGLAGILYVHFVGSRIGIIGIWLSMAIMLWQVLRSKDFFVKLWILLAVWLVGIALYYAVPTFRMRIRYAFYDVGQIINNRDIVNFSDAKRIASWVAGWNALDGNYLTGVGHYNARQKVAEYLTNKFGFSQDQIIVPHSEFLWIMVRAGIIGLVLFLVGLFIFVHSTWNYFTATVHVAYLVRMLIDVPLGTQHAIIGYVLLLAWSVAVYKFFENERKE